MRRSGLGMGAALVVALGLLAACRSASPPAVTPALPSDALPGHPAAAQPLTARDLAAEALDHGAALSELDLAGFVAGSSRTFASPDPGVRTLRARILRFGSGEGAAGYLGWLREHLRTIVGNGRVSEADLPSSGFVFVHRPGGCCPKEQPVAIGVWQRGPTLLWVEAIGAVGAGDAVRYANALDSAI